MVDTYVYTNTKFCLYSIYIYNVTYSPDQFQRVRWNSDRGASWQIAVGRRHSHLHVPIACVCVCACECVRACVRVCINKYMVCIKKPWHYAEVYTYPIWGFQGVDPEEIATHNPDYKLS
jgi:hypothetical protein